MHSDLLRLMNRVFVGQLPTLVILERCRIRSCYHDGYAGGTMIQNGEATLVNLTSRAYAIPEPGTTALMSLAGAIILLSLYRSQQVAALGYILYVAPQGNFGSPLAPAS